MFSTLKKFWKGGRMKNRQNSIFEDAPLIYYKTKEEIDAYRKKPVKQKLQWLEAQMEFFYKAMPAKAKRMWEKINSGKL